MVKPMLFRFLYDDDVGIVCATMNAMHDLQRILRNLPQVSYYYPTRALCDSDMAPPQMNDEPTVWITRTVYQLCRKCEEPVFRALGPLCRLKLDMALYAFPHLVHYFIDRQDLVPIAFIPTILHEP